MWRNEDKLYITWRQFKDPLEEYIQKYHFLSIFHIFHIYSIMHNVCYPFYSLTSFAFYSTPLRMPTVSSEKFSFASFLCISFPLHLLYAFLNEMYSTILTFSLTFLKSVIALSLSFHVSLVFCWNSPQKKIVLTTAVF